MYCSRYKGLSFNSERSCHVGMLNLRNGIKLAGGVCIDYGLLTTPQLHFLVEHNNIE